jgi:NAD-dependent deacetylase
VVWFGEALPTDAVQRAWDAAESCEIMLVVGTSALVQPAASLPMVGKAHGAYVVEVNLDATPLTGIADETHYGKAGEILPRLLGPLARPRSLAPGPQSPIRGNP